MRKFIIPLMAVGIVAALLLGCMPGAPEVPPVTPPPVEPPVTPPPVEPPVTPPAVGCTPPPHTPPGGATSWVGTCADPDAYVFEPSHSTTVEGIPTSEPEGIWDGFAVKPDGTPYHFHWDICTLDMVWCTTATGVVESLIKRAGGTVDTLDAAMDVDKEIAALEDAAVKGGIDAFIMCPVGTVSILPTVEKLLDMGYTVISMGVIVPGPAIVSTCSHDFVNLGEQAGLAFAEYAEEKGEPITVYELWGMYGHYDAVQRHTGLHNILDGNPMVEVVESPECMYMSPLAADAVIDSFSAHPEWDAVSDMGNMCAGVIEGLRTIDRLYPVGDPRHVFVVAQDGPPAAMDALVDETIDVCIAHSPWANADGVVKVAFTYVILGQPVHRLYNCRTYPLTVEHVGNPNQWGNALNMGIPFDDWPVLHVPDIIETPTLQMRMELCGY